MHQQKEKDIVEVGSQSGGAEHETDGSSNGKEDEEAIDESALQSSVQNIVEAMRRLRNRERKYHSLQREKEAAEGKDHCEAHEEAEALRKCEEEVPTCFCYFLLN